MNSSITSHDPSFTNPRTEADRQWNELRDEVLSLRDAVRTYEAEATAQAQRMDEKDRELKKAREERDLCMTKCIAMEAAVRNGASIFYDVLKASIDAKSVPDQFGQRQNLPNVNLIEKGEDVSAKDAAAIGEIINRRPISGS